MGQRRRTWRLSIHTEHWKASLRAGADFEDEDDASDPEPVTTTRHVEELMP